MYEVSLVVHPEFEEQYLHWIKWRRAYVGGQQFIRHYLQRYTSRETAEEFDARMQLSYCPAFAKQAVNEIKNSIYQRMSDISRVGGSPSYQDAIAGRNGGVDQACNSMSSFMGGRVLSELLSMGAVGIYVDMPRKRGPTLRDTYNQHPYLYLYPREDIRSWTYEAGEWGNELSSVLLQDWQYTQNPDSGFPSGAFNRYRRFWKADGGVYASLYEYIDETYQEIGEQIFLPLKHIPFVILDIGMSLMTDIADYQIALLNLASSDLSYVLKANFPFYTEQFDPRTTNPYLRVDGDESQEQEIRVGTTAGRRYPLEAERPGFINPSSEPLDASMRKQQQLKEEIKQLLHLTVQNLPSQKNASAESKAHDDKSLESGLSFIGLVMELGERRVAETWASYEGSREVATVNYPRNYSLKSDQDRIEEATKLDKLSHATPSKSYQKEVSKKIANILLGNNVSIQTLNDIYSEIDSADAINANPEYIAKDVEIGILSHESAAKIRGYPVEEAKKANTEHADRLARIAVSQSNMVGTNGAARGIPDLGSPGSGKEEKKPQATDPIVEDRSRGKGQNNQKD